MPVLTRIGECNSCESALEPEHPVEFTGAVPTAAAVFSDGSSRIAPVPETEAQPLDYARGKSQFVVVPTTDRKQRVRDSGVEGYRLKTPLI